MCLKNGNLSCVITGLFLDFSSIIVSISNVKVRKLEMDLLISIIPTYYYQIFLLCYRECLA